MKTVHLPVMGHDILAVERFQDGTRHMAEFLVLKDCSLGRKDQYVRRFLSEDSYAQVLAAQREGSIRIYKYAFVIEGHIIPGKKKKRRGKCK